MSFTNVNSLEVYIGQYVLGFSIIIFNMTMIAKGVNPEVNYAMIGGILGYFLPSPSYNKASSGTSPTTGFPTIRRQPVDVSPV